MTSDGQKAITYATVERVLVTVISSNDPTDDEFDAYYTWSHARDGAWDAKLVYSMGGALNAKQRRQTTSQVKPTDPSVAVMTDSVFMRGVVTALAAAAFGSKMKAFALDDFEAPFLHLALGRARSEAVRAEVARLIPEVTPGAATSA